MIQMENTKEACIICFEENQEKILFDCNHSICLVCYSKLLKNDNVLCPICRKEIDRYVNSVYISVPNLVPVPIVAGSITEERSRIRWKGVMCLVGLVLVVIIIFVTISVH